VTKGPLGVSTRARKVAVAAAVAGTALAAAGVLEALRRTGRLRAGHAVAVLRRRTGRLRVERGMAALGLAARGGARYASSAPRLFAAAGEHREQLRNDLALQTA